MEALHFPAALWIIYSLAFRKPGPHPQTPLVLLVYGLQTVLTTATCIADLQGWDENVVSWGEKMNLLTLYGPYAAVSAYMSVDSGWRIASVLGNVDVGRQVSKKMQ